MTNEESHPYVIAFHDSGEGNRFWINYYPFPNVFRSASPIVSVFFGSIAGTRQSPCFEPAEMLGFVMGRSVWKEVDGKMKHFGYEYEPPGWFRRQCEAADCLWFYGLVERMAAGEEIPIEEIKAAYRENNGGKDLVQKPIYEMR